MELEIVKGSCDGYDDVVDDGSGESGDDDDGNDKQQIKHIKLKSETAVRFRIFIQLICNSLHR